MKMTESEEKTLREEVRQKLGKAIVEKRRIGDFLCTTALLQSGYVLIYALSQLMRISPKI